MLVPPGDIEESSIDRALAEHWAIEVEEIAYAPVGFGAHHWSVTDSSGSRWFITLDDLDMKPELGADRDTTFRGLQAEYGSAAALRDDAGLTFVLAPLPSIDGDATHRLDSRWAISVTPFVDGTAGSWGDVLEADRLDELASMLADLHRTDTEAIDLPVDSLDTYRQPVIALLESLDVPWTAGPWSAAAYEWCVDHRAAIAELLDAPARLATRVTTERLVVTHGEPHPANLLVAHDTTWLIDWDTVALSIPERDLWLAAGGSADVRDEEFIEAYERYADRAVDRTALAFAAQAWLLGDVATLAGGLRAPHERDAHSDAMWGYLTGLDLASPLLQY